MISRENKGWRADRAKEVDEGTQSAQFLVGRTIAEATIRPHMDECDGVNVLRLRFEDGTVVDVEGSYWGYTGHSCDEYPERISVRAL